MLAAIALAIAAEHARLDRQPFRVLVGLAEVARRLGKRVVAVAFGRLAKKRRAERLLLRRGRVLPRARLFEDVAAGNLLSLEVARLARNTQQIFEAVVVRLEVGVRHAPILEG